MGARHPCKFRQTDLKRAVQALKAAGVKIDRVEVEADGKINVIVKDDSELKSTTNNPWDKHIK